MQEEAGGQLDIIIETHEMMTGMCEDEEVEELNLKRGEYQDTRGLPQEDKKEVEYTKLQQTQCMNGKGKSSFCIVNSDRAYIATKLADVIYDSSRED